MKTKPTSNPAWTRSNMEEVLAALYLVAGNTAWEAGIHWLAWICWAKAALDTWFSLRYASADLETDSRPTPSK